jgi:aminoglycoside 3-N-acetyltransferase
MANDDQKALFYSDSGAVTKKDFVHALAKVGVKKGDTIMVHSSIGVFGKLAVFDRNALFQELIDSLKESVGNEGTIIMPAFSFSFAKNEPYDADNSKSTVGALTDFFRKQPGVSRTLHPNHSVGVWGKHKDELMKVGKGTFDEDSIFGKLHKLNGKLVFFGSTFGTCTYVHYIERMHGVPHRHQSKFKGKVIANGKESEEEITFYNKYNIFFVSLDRMEKHLLESKMLKEAAVGNGKISMIGSDVLFKEGLKVLDKDPMFFLKNKPFVFGLFNRCMYPFLKYAPWLVKIFDKIMTRLFKLNKTTKN